MLAVGVVYINVGVVCIDVGVVNVGVALLHLHCANTLSVHSEGCVAKAYLETAQRTIKPFLLTLDNHRSTFLCGAAGPLAIMAILYHKLGIGDPLP